MSSRPLGTAGGHHPSDDSDLEDLLASKAGGGGGSGAGGVAASGGGGVAGSSPPDAAEIDLDRLARDDDPAGGGGSGRFPRPRDVASASRLSSSYASRYNRYYAPAGPLAALYAHLCLFLSHRPACGWMCTLLGLAGGAYLLAYAADPSGRVGAGEIKHDWTTVRSELDLKAGDIDHWCLGGGDSSCRCEDPLIPADRGEYKSWTAAHVQNKRAIRKYLDGGGFEGGEEGSSPPEASEEIDVAFVGESLIEEMDGRWLGMTKGEHLEGLAKLFERHFRKDKGGALEGVALGIAGDSAPNVLWRLLHGEMPPDFNPKVWWVSLGMNDLARMRCSEEVVIMGVIRVVEEIRREKPDARVVVNSILPMHDLRSGLFPQQVDYRDAFRGDVVGRGRWRNGKQPVPPSHVARNPNAAKRIQGEPENPPPADRGGGRGERFPGGKGRRRLLPGMGDGDGGGHLASPLERVLGMRKKKRLSPEEQRLADRDARAAEREKRRERMEKELAKRVRRDRVNPLLRNREKYKKLDPGKLFVRKTQVPLWPAITAINGALRKFAEKQDHVSFFDATDIFAERRGPRTYVLLSDMISPRGHPTDEGFRRWEDAVAGRLHYMLDVKPGQKAEKKKEAAAAAASAASLAEETMERAAVPPAAHAEGEREDEKGEDESESEEADDEKEEDGSESEEADDEKEEDGSESEEADDEKEEDEEPAKKTKATKKKATKEEEEEEEKEEKEKEPVKKTTKKKMATLKKVAKEEEEEEKPVKKTTKKGVSTKTRAREDEEE